MNLLSLARTPRTKLILPQILPEVFLLCMLIMVTCPKIENLKEISELMANFLCLEK